MKELLHLRANVAFPAAYLNTKSDNREDSRDLAVGLPNEVRDVGGDQGDGDFDESIIKHMRQPKNGQLAHEPTEQWTHQSHSRKVEENIKT